MTSSDLLRAVIPLAEAFEDLGVRYYIGGSVASSVHGVPRASIDADVVADLQSSHVPRLVGALAGAYYVSEERIRAAVDARRSFNVIHLETMFKIDVFVAKGRPFDRQVFARARGEALEDAHDTRRLPVASREDVVLTKLEWFRAGGEVSERQWADVVGLLKTGGDRLDRAYLERWARSLGVQDLLDRAARDASD